MAEPKYDVTQYAEVYNRVANFNSITEIQKEANRTFGSSYSESVKSLQLLLIKYEEGTEGKSTLSGKIWTPGSVIGYFDGEGEYKYHTTEAVKRFQIKQNLTLRSYGLPPLPEDGVADLRTVQYLIHEDMKLDGFPKGLNTYQNFSDNFGNYLTVDSRKLVDDKAPANNQGAPGNAPANETGNNTGGNNSGQDAYGPEWAYYASIVNAKAGILKLGTLAKDSPVPADQKSNFDLLRSLIQKRYGNDLKGLEEGIRKNGGDPAVVLKSYYADYEKGIWGDGGMVTVLKAMQTQEGGTPSKDGSLDSATLRRLLQVTMYTDKTLYGGASDIGPKIESFLKDKYDVAATGPGTGLGKAAETLKNDKGPDLAGAAQRIAKGASDGDSDTAPERTGAGNDNAPARTNTGNNRAPARTGGASAPSARGPLEITSFKGAQNIANLQKALYLGGYFKDAEGKEVGKVAVAGTYDEATDKALHNAYKKLHSDHDGTTKLTADQLEEVRVQLNKEAKEGNWTAAKVGTAGKGKGKSSKAPAAGAEPDRDDDKKDKADDDKDDDKSAARPGAAPGAGRPDATRPGAGGSSPVTGPNGGSTLSDMLIDYNKLVNGTPAEKAKEEQDFGDALTTVGFPYDRNNPQSKARALADFRRAYGVQDNAGSTVDTLNRLLLVTVNSNRQKIGLPPLDTASLGIDLGDAAQSAGQTAPSAPSGEQGAGQTTPPGASGGQTTGAGSTGAGPTRPPVGASPSGNPQGGATGGTTAGGTNPGGTTAGGTTPGATTAGGTTPTLPAGVTQQQLDSTRTVVTQLAQVFGIQLQPEQMNSLVNFFITVMQNAQQGRFPTAQGQGVPQTTVQQTPITNGASPTFAQDPARDAAVTALRLFNKEGYNGEGNGQQPSLNAERELPKLLEHLGKNPAEAKALLARYDFNRSKNLGEEELTQFFRDNPDLAVKLTGRVASSPTQQTTTPQQPVSQQTVQQPTGSTQTAPTAPVQQAPTTPAPQTPPVVVAPTTQTPSAPTAPVPPVASGPTAPAGSSTPQTPTPPPAQHTPATSSGADILLKRGDRNDQVRDLQRYLILSGEGAELMYERITGTGKNARKHHQGIDGIYGPRTESAVGDMEERFKQGRDGKADRKFVETLRAYVEGKEIKLPDGSTMQLTPEKRLYNAVHYYDDTLRLGSKEAARRGKELVDYVLTTSTLGKVASTGEPPPSVQQDAVQAVNMQAIIAQYGAVGRKVTVDSLIELGYLDKGKALSASEEDIKGAMKQYIEKKNATLPDGKKLDANNPINSAALTSLEADARAKQAETARKELEAARKDAQAELTEAQQKQRDAAPAEYIPAKDAKVAGDAVVTAMDANRSGEASKEEISAKLNTGIDRVKHMLSALGLNDEISKDNMQDILRNKNNVLTNLSGEDKALFETLVGTGLNIQGVQVADGGLVQVPAGQSKNIAGRMQGQ